MERDRANQGGAALPVRAGGLPRTKQMQTFRMPRELVAELKRDAASERRHLTGHVIRLLEGTRSYFGLPEAAVALLEADRHLLCMGRFEYLVHALYQRSAAVRERGTGHDAPLTRERHRGGTEP
ncbi:MAG TPA: hypothetical protein VF875_10450 [Anaeromyxobacter sp.]